MPEHKNSFLFFFLSCNITRSHIDETWPHGQIHMDQDVHNDLFTHMSSHTTWHEKNKHITLRLEKHESQDSLKKENFKLSEIKLKTKG